MEIPGEKLVSHMMTLLFENGIGGLLRPWQIKRIARAETDAQIERTRRLVQAEREYDEIRAGRLLVSPDGELLRIGAPSLEMRDLRRIQESPTPGYAAAQQVIIASATEAVADNLRRDINVARAILAAESELLRDAPEQEIPENAPDGDWLHRWRDAASEVSSEELQSVWGRVLAGEMRAPGSFSLRTLAFLRNISRKDAEAIENLSQYIVHGFLFRGNLPFLDSKGVNFDFIQKMADLGILGSQTFGVDTTITTPPIEQRFAAVLRAKGRAIVASHADPSRTRITLPTYPVTELGSEVLRLTSEPPSEELLRIVGCTIARLGYAVGLADYEALVGGRYRLSNAQVLECPANSGAE